MQSGAILTKSQLARLSRACSCGHHSCGSCAHDHNLSKADRCSLVEAVFDGCTMILGHVSWILVALGLDVQ